MVLAFSRASFRPSRLWSSRAASVRHPPQPVVTARASGESAVALSGIDFPRTDPRAPPPPRPCRLTATARTASVSTVTSQPWRTSDPAPDIFLATPRDAIPRCASSPTISVTPGSRDKRAGVCAPDAHPAWLSSAASTFHVEHFGSARAVGECPRRQTAAAGALCAAAPRVAPPATASRPSMRRLPAAQLRSVNRISLGHAPMPAARDAWDSDSREVRTPT